MNKRWYFIIIVILVILLSGCAEVQVYNLADQSIRVRVTTPDGGNPIVKRIYDQQIEFFTSGNGGSFYVEMIPDEQYLTMAQELEATITARLWAEGATLSADEVARLVRNLSGLQQAVDEMINQNLSCRINVPFGETGVATFVYDFNLNVITLHCSLPG